MAFAYKSLYSTEWLEALVTALLTMVALRSFEYIMKALLVSAGSERVSISQFALAVTADQAWNPLNYISWLRGSPDFKVQAVPTKGEFAPRRKVPLRRATIALSIAVLALIAEAAFFWGTQTRREVLTDSQLQIAMNQSDANQDTKMKRNTCEPIYVKEGRAKFSGILAACNVVTGRPSPVAQGTNLTQKILRTQFSIGIEITGEQNMSSETTFTLMLPRVANLVVRLNNDLQTNPATEVRKHYESLGCSLSGSDVSALTLSNCEREVDPYDALEIIVRFVRVVQDGPVGEDVGEPVDDIIVKSTGTIPVGFIYRQNYTAIAILAITAVLFVLAVFCHALVADDTNEVIACMLRERTGQDVSTPTVAMGDGEVRILRSFSEEKQEWYVGTVVPDGYEERAV